MEGWKTERLAGVMGAEICGVDLHRDLSPSLLFFPGPRQSTRGSE